MAASPNMRWLQLFLVLFALATKTSGSLNCCPAGSLGPATVRSDRPLQGVMVTIPSTAGFPSMPCYCTGNSLIDAKHVVVIFTDVYGIDSGHHKVFADCLAERLECAVVMPDLFRGVPILQSDSPRGKTAAGYRLFKYTPVKVEGEIFRMIMPYIRSQLGGKNDNSVKVSCVGFCFGGWVVGRVLGYHQQQESGDSALTFQCGVGIHPSFRPNLFHFERPITMAKRIQKPILLLPAKTDELKPNTKLVNIMKDGLAQLGHKSLDVAIEFPTMDHGWVSRGNLADPQVVIEQEKALNLAVKFIKMHGT